MDATDVRVLEHIAQACAAEYPGGREQLFKDIKSDEHEVVMWVIGKAPQLIPAACHSTGKAVVPADATDDAVVIVEHLKTYYANQLVHY